MRLKSLVTVSIAGLSLAACGSSSSSSSNSNSSGSGSSTSSGQAVSGKKVRHHGAAASGRIYHLKLTGQAETPTGAPNGAGSAVIALHGHSRKVCWRFSHLRGFSSATAAHIHKGAKGTSGNIVVPLSTSGKLHHRGCVSASAAQIQAIAKDPTAYYVNVHSKKYPAGAVRSQL